jgi:hypothetical protein
LEKLREEHNQACRRLAVTDVEITHLRQEGWIDEAKELAAAFQDDDS